MGLELRPGDEVLVSATYIQPQLHIQITSKRLRGTISVITETKNRKTIYYIETQDWGLVQAYREWLIPLEPSPEELSTAIESLREAIDEVKCW